MTTNKVNNDQEIEKMLKLVEEKKSSIEKIEIAKFKTNQTFSTGDIDGYSTGIINISTYSDGGKLLKLLTTITNAKDIFEKSCKENSLDLTFTIGNHSYDDLKSDILTRIKKLSISGEKQKLSILEKRLEALISEETKAKRELDAIKAELGL